MKHFIPLFIFITVLVIVGCNPYSDFTYKFDMSGTGNSSRALTRAMTDSDVPLSHFEKYEIEVVFVYIALFDTEGISGMSYDRHTLYNTTIGSGKKVDLVTQNLSDVLPLSIENPKGNGIDKIYVGLGTVVTAKGYVNCNGTIYRTMADGTMSPDGDTEDAQEGVFDIDGFEIPAFSVDESNPPAEANVKGIYLWLASGGKKHAGHDDLVFSGDQSTIDLKFPLEAGLIKFSGSWASGSLDWVTPYINGTSKYEKYYLKKAGETYYTDLMRVLTDNNGNAVVGQLVLGAVSDTNALFTNRYNMWYEADNVVGLPDAEIDAVYAQWFKQASASTYYFKASGGGTDIISCDSFQRANHSGTILINGTATSYTCLKIEE